MWSDKESKIDFLNFNETAQSIKDLITEKDLMPISVGVFGDWGAGKSTILELTKKSLDTEEQQYIQVHFDAWMFQGYDDAKAALLETIASKLVKQAESDKGLICSPSAIKLFYPQLIPWIMGISKFGRRAVGGRSTRLPAQAGR